MSANKSYIRKDNLGVYRVGQTRVSLDSVVYSFLQGSSPEFIAEQYPALSLEEVYGAITFFLGNRAEVDVYLKQQEKVWEERRAESDENPSPLIERLRAQRANLATRA